MAEILIASEEFVKEVTSISDNTASKYITSSLREAQEIHLKGIVGDALLKRMKESRDMGGDMGKELLDRCRYYLAYMTIVEVAFKVSYKIGNAGVVKATDEQLQVATLQEILANKEYYQGKADAYCKEIQHYILENRSAFPEVDDNTCHRMKGNLYSAATCGFFLGGARGKRRR